MLSFVSSHAMFRTSSYIEDYLPFSGTNQWRLPDEFEIRDALVSIKQMGGKVARIYVFSVRKEGDTVEIFHVECPGKFNEEAFKTFDKVLQIADEVGIQLLDCPISLTIGIGGEGRKNMLPFAGNQRMHSGPTSS